MEGAWQKSRNRAQSVKEKMNDALKVTSFNFGLSCVLTCIGVFTLLVYVNLQRYPDVKFGSSRSLQPEQERENTSQHFLTIFTTWTYDDETSHVQNITIMNWSRFRPEVKFVVYTNDVKIVSQLQGLRDWYTRKVPKSVTPRKIPILKYMYIETMKHFNSKFYSFVNSDILFTQSLIHTMNSLDLILNVSKNYLLLVGRRVNVLGINEMEATSDMSLTIAAKTRGMLMPSFAADYFISNTLFPWMYIPDLVIGVPRYDNWLMQLARNEAIVGIDVSETVLAVHHSITTDFQLSFKRPYADFNDNLLKLMFGTASIPDGRSDCLPLLTKYANDNRTVVLVNRTEYQTYCG